MIHKVLLLFVIILFVPACSSDSFQDSLSSLVESDKQYTFPEGEYDEVAWLDDGRVAFLFLPPTSTNYLNQWEWKIIVYQLEQEDWHELAIPVPSECHVAWFSHLSRLPTGHLGFLLYCSIDTSNAYMELYKWDPNTDGLQVMQKYPSPFAAASYAYSPDMQQLIQERAVGPGLSNQLFHIDGDNSPERLFSDWRRVKEPTWSIDGEQVAFLGNPSTIVGNNSEGFDKIRDEFLYPWNVYLMDGNLDDVTLLLENVPDRSLKWLPHSRILSVSGEYAQTTGLWLIDTENPALERIWPHMAAYDWAPDGQEIVILPNRYDPSSPEIKTPLIFKVLDSLTITK
ncbi:MAG: TolB family protein [Anaerolineales bacterium]